MSAPRHAPLVRRNPVAVAARLRGGAGAMRHRCAPRGGARNQTSDWLALAAELEGEELPTEKSEDPSVTGDGTPPADADQRDRWGTLLE
jgi:hypothetical protein